MKTTLRHAVRGCRGTSLVEILITLTIMAIITTAIFNVYLTQHKNYLIQEDVTAVQQNARASIDEIGRQIRMAGHGLPLEMAPLRAINANPDTIVVTYRTGDCETFLSAAMPQPSAELKCGSDVSCFEEGQWVYIFEPDSGGGEWFVLTHVQTGSNHLQHNTMTLSKKYAKDAIVMSVNQVKFYVDATTDPRHPSLMLEVPCHAPQVFATDIEDLQFRYRMKNGVIVDQPVVVDDVREVIITLTARSAHEDPNMAQIGGHDDSYRRRSFTTSVFLRNVGI